MSTDSPANALDAAESCALGMQHSKVCVNVAPVTLLEPDFAQWLGNPAAWPSWGTLQLEMTEHAIIAVA